jgi:hypothetical protein
MYFFSHFRSTLYGTDGTHWIYRRARADRKAAKLHKIEAGKEKDAPKHNTCCEENNGCVKNKI